MWKPTNRQISLRAHQIWKETQREDALANWQQAERELEWFGKIARQIDLDLNKVTRCWDDCASETYEENSEYTESIPDNAENKNADMLWKNPFRVVSQSPRATQDFFPFFPGTVRPESSFTGVNELFVSPKQNIQSIRCITITNQTTPTITRHPKWRHRRPQKEIEEDFRRYNLWNKFREPKFVQTTIPDCVKRYEDCGHMEI